MIDVTEILEGTKKLIELLHTFKSDQERLLFLLQYAKESNESKTNDIV
jgi:hypothetical protein